MKNKIYNLLCKTANYSTVELDLDTKYTEIKMVNSKTNSIVRTQKALQSFLLF